MVGWVPSSIGDPAISFDVHIQGYGTDQVVTVDEGTSYNLNFSGLESNTMYSITVTATTKNITQCSCMGRGQEDKVHLGLKIKKL